MIRWGTECARTGRWRSDKAVAFLVPVPEGVAPSAEFARRCLGLLAAQGFERVVTVALSPTEQSGFLEAGFVVHEHLHLLVLDSAVTIPPPPDEPRLHRAGLVFRGGVLGVDAAAFAPFWRLDRAGLREALLATPERRLRVVLGKRHKVVGYAICGAAGERGFVQRLAVDPQSQGQGLGKRLLLDGLAWLRSAGARQIVVNTQKGNNTALRLYRQVGFRDDPAGLCVLSAGLNGCER